MLLQTADPGCVRVMAFSDWLLLIGYQVISHHSRRAIQLYNSYLDGNVSSVW